MDAAPDLAFSEQGKKALDLVEPGCAGGGQVDVPARPLGQPTADQRRLVRGVVVDDEMNIQIARHVRLDLVEEFAELGGAMARKASADDPACGNVERGEQRGCAVAGIVVAA